MKPKEITLSQGQYDHYLEQLIITRHPELTELARKNGRHFGRINKPDPFGDKLTPFISDIKAGYEELSSTVFHKLQPQTHFPEAKMDSDYYKERDKALEANLADLEGKNQQAEYELHHFEPAELPVLGIVALFFSVLILIGEVFFNMKALQLIVDSLVSGLLASLSLAVGIVMAAHFTAYLYTRAKTKLRRWVIGIVSTTIVSIVFYIIALIRSQYLSRHDVQISPFYFVVFNLFFFCINTFLAFATLPVLEKFKDHLRHLRSFRAIKKRKKEIKKLQDQKMRLKEEKRQTEKERARIIYYAQYLNERVKRMYLEAVGIFKGTNLIYRPDKLTPDCFNDIPEDISSQDIQHPVNNNKEIHR